MFIQKVHQTEVRTEGTETSMCTIVMRAANRRNATHSVYITTPHAHLKCGVAGQDQHICTWTYTYALVYSAVIMFIQLVYSMLSFMGSFYYLESEQCCLFIKLWPQNHMLKEVHQTNENPYMASVTDNSWQHGERSTEAWPLFRHHLMSQIKRHNIVSCMRHHQYWQLVK